MQKITQESFTELLSSAAIRPRIKREVRFTTSTQGEAWDTSELVAVSDRAGNKGVLLLSDGQNLYATEYEISRGITSKTGKAQPIICDFCRTWQTGSRSGSVTLQKSGRGAGSISFLCCADLACSQHVRNLTSAAKTSRSQLREDMTPEQRIERLEARIAEIAQLLGLTPVRVS